MDSQPIPATPKLPRGIFASYPMPVHLWVLRWVLRLVVLTLLVFAGWAMLLGANDSIAHHGTPPNGCASWESVGNAC